MVAENNFPNDCCLEFLQFTGCTVKIEKVKSKSFICVDFSISNCLLCNLDFRTKSENSQVKKATSCAKIDFYEVLLSSSKSSMNK